MANTLLPPSDVNRCRKRTLRYETPNFSSLHLVVSPRSATFSMSRMAEGAKSKASPAFKLMIWTSIRSRASLAVFVDVSNEAAAK